MRRVGRCDVGSGEVLSGDGESAAVKPDCAPGGCFEEVGSLGGRGMRGSGAGRTMAVPRMPQTAADACSTATAGSSRRDWPVKPGPCGRTACGFGSQAGSAGMAAREGRGMCVAGTGVTPKLPEVCNGRSGGTTGSVHVLRLAGSLDSMAFTDFRSLSFPGGGRQSIVRSLLREKLGVFPFQPHVC